MTPLAPESLHANPEYKNNSGRTPTQKNRNRLFGIFYNAGNSV